MRVLFVIPLLALLFLPISLSAEVKTFTATHTYILGDHDSKDDARQRCLLEAKRKVLEQAGVYIESASEVKDFAITKDKIASFAAAVMQVKQTKEDVGFQQGHITLTLTINAAVDMAQVRKQLAARQVDKEVRDDVAQQKERLKRLEGQLETMQQQRQGGQGAAQPPASPPSDLSAEDLQTLHTQATQDDVLAQVRLGVLYHFGRGVPRDYAMARQWYEKAAAQGNAQAQFNLGVLYDFGQGVPQDYATARQWYEQAAAQGNASAQFFLGGLYDLGQGVPQDYGAARQWWEKAAAQGHASAQFNLGVLYGAGQGVPQDYVKTWQWFEQAAAQGDADAQSKLGMLYYQGNGVPQDYVRAYMWFNLAAARSTGTRQKTAADIRDTLASRMTPAQLAEAQRLAQQCQARQFKGC